ncbi:hypothetical protein [Falsiruegeria mediterranea]|uniref:Uncharacterized protein n=1 Tax=Falsiruegeria mediterranea M17 TaxID=1200281 RepID=A0A2R8CCA0_9RHOB|nr:hypothetical protein [Falsiruegeria mediterranea]SPJ30036.1 hypothetical protein TRM7615_03564 [Falsiruegeria mediterranea M17]
MLPGVWAGVMRSGAQSQVVLGFGGAAPVAVRLPRRIFNKKKWGRGACSQWLSFLALEEVSEEGFMRVLFLGLAMALMASVAAASDRAALIAQIEAGGQNEYEDRRHSVEVNECQLTTYFWKKVAGEGWVLWTSFKIPMLLVDLAESKTEYGFRHFFAAEGDTPIAVINLKAKDGTDFPHEKSVLRKPKGELVPSQRNGGDTHFIERQTDVIIMHVGPDVIEKAEMFTKGYIRYVQEYCAFTG